jgi:hypothetical protein
MKAFFSKLLKAFGSPITGIILIAWGTLSIVTAPTVGACVTNAVMVILLGIALYWDTIIKANDISA